MANSHGSGRRPPPAPVKIHHFKAAPRKHKPLGRDQGRTTLELERPTLPEMPIDEPPEQAEAELARPTPAERPEPVAAEKARASKKSRASRRASAAEEEPAPGSIAERLNTSRRMVAEGKFDEARVVLERLETLGVATGPVHTQLGAIYMAQGFMDRALERFEDALSMDSMDLFARLCRGEARLERGDLRLAQEDLQCVLDMGTAGSPLVERAQQLLQRAGTSGERKRY